MQSAVRDHELGESPNVVVDRADLIPHGRGDDSDEPLAADDQDVLNELEPCVDRPAGHKNLEHLGVDVQEGGLGEDGWHLVHVVIVGIGEVAQWLIAFFHRDRRRSGQYLPQQIEGAGEVGPVSESRIPLWRIPENGGGRPEHLAVREGEDAGVAGPIPLCVDPADQALRLREGGQSEVELGGKDQAVALADLLITGYGHEADVGIGVGSRLPKHIQQVQFKSSSIWHFVSFAGIGPTSYSESRNRKGTEVFRSGSLFRLMIIPSLLCACLAAFTVRCTPPFSLKRRQPGSGRCPFGLGGWLSGMLLVVAFSGAAVRGANTCSAKVEGSEARYANGDVQLAATWMRPAGVKRPPAVVLLQGSGTSGRDNAWSALIADSLVKCGVAVLFTDKRGSGESKGDWRTSSLLDLAADGAAGMKWVAQQNNIDPRRLGYVGLSQGGQVAPAAAKLSPSASFVVGLVSSVGPLKQALLYELEQAYRQHGLDDSQIEALQTMARTSFKWLETGPGWEDYQAQRSAIANGPLALAVKTWPATQNDPYWTFWRKNGSYDLLPYWRYVIGHRGLPGLAVFGEHDTKGNVDVPSTTASLRAGPRQARNCYHSRRWA